MPTFAEWEAKRRGGLAGAPLSQPSASDAPGPDSPHYPGLETDATDPNGERLSFTQDPARYLGHAAKGLIRSPLDLVKGVLGIPGQVVKGLTHDLPALVKDPSLILEAPGALKEGAQWANTHPDEVGSMFGQTILAPKAPGAVNATLAKGPSLAGRAASAVGRGAEAVGKSGPLRHAAKFGAMEAALRMDPKGLALAAAPEVLQYGGRGLQKLGGSLEGLDLSVKGRAPFAGAPGRYDAEGKPAPEDFTPQSTGTKTHGGQQMPELSMDDVALAREMMAKGEEGVPDYYPNQNSYREGVKNTAVKVVGGKSAQSQSVLRGLMDAAEKGKAAKAAAGDNAWANDASAVDPGQAAYAEGQAKGKAAYGDRADILRDRFRRRAAGESWDSIEADAPLNAAPERPIDTFYRNDPAAKVGGEGRMTGQFDEGAGGLADLAAGKLGPPGPPLDSLDSRITGLAPASPLDELSRLSGRGVGATDAQRLLSKLGGRGR